MNHNKVRNSLVSILAKMSESWKGQKTPHRPKARIAGGGRLLEKEGLGSGPAPRKN